ncbi:MAG: DeoR/GlpR family DNA-binding transcription regulator [Treponema sp.]|jgi:DeoR family transcriptional regulator of aga operon/DeoR family fructose operon transcriptional repressor|nr:DeoR/GlpR family DNA-binding transcription regulator [Treponema sp.]
MERSGTPESPVFCGWKRRFTAQLRSKKYAIKLKKVNAGVLAPKRKKDVMQHERRNEIMTKIRAQRSVKVSDLMEEYKVSIETIRRDLEYLENQGLLRRVYGGAVLHGFYGEEPEHDSRAISHYQEKEAIGKKAAEFVKDGDTLFIDNGTTTMEVARELRSRKNLTVITNATLIAQELIKNNPACRVILLGGEMRRDELTLSGTITETNLEQFYATKMILAMGGISLEAGITDYHIQESSVRRRMIQRSSEVIGVADYSKFGVVALNFICPLEKVHIMVTDWNIPAKVITEYRSRGLNIYATPKPEQT